MHPHTADPAFDLACRILILGGMIQILWGLLTGIPMGLIRAQNPEVPKYLTLTHVGGLMQGPLLFGLVFAVQLSGLPAVWEIAAASLVCVAAILLVIKDFLNWKLGVVDEFATRSLGYVLGSILAPLYLAGCLILAIGVIGSMPG